MEEEVIDPPGGEEPKPGKKHIPEVYILRDWKEYAGESLLIIFSVLLALVLTEYFNTLHEKNDTKELLNNIRNELTGNKKFETELYTYDQQVLKSIDSALANPAMQKLIISNGEFNLKRIAPQGVQFRYLNDVAWEIAKSHNISSKIDFKTDSLLTYIYQEQAKTMKIDDEMGKIILSSESRKAENAHVTLILIRDTYKAWAVDRAQGLLYEQDKAIKLLNEEK